MECPQLPQLQGLQKSCQDALEQLRVAVNKRNSSALKPDRCVATLRASLHSALSSLGAVIGRPLIANPQTAALLCICQQARSRIYYNQ